MTATTRTRVGAVAVGPGGEARYILGDPAGEAIAGRVTSVRRASHVEVAEDLSWTADLRPSGGPLLAGFATREAALAAEADWIVRHGLPVPAAAPPLAAALLQAAGLAPDDPGSDGRPMAEWAAEWAAFAVTMLLLNRETDE